MTRKREGDGSQMPANEPAVGESADSVGDGGDDKQNMREFAGKAGKKRAKKPSQRVDKVEQNWSRERVRLFLGIELSTAAVRDLAQVAVRIRTALRDSGTRVRWVAPTSYHVTLKFLGWTPPEVVAAMRDRLAAPVGAIESFNIQGRGLGAFPRATRAQVLWAGVDDPTGGLNRLALVADEACEEIGFERDLRPFHPHVTLGRLKPPGALNAHLGDGSEQVFRQCRISRVVLFESVIKSVGSEYRPQVSWALARAPAGG